MTEQWDGRPQDAERDGVHWLRSKLTGHLLVAEWCATHGVWLDDAATEHMWLGKLYVGPCLTPAEVEARVAAARREGIEAALPLLAASDEVLSGLATGECEQFMYAEFAPVVGAFRALLTESGR